MVAALVGLQAKGYITLFHGRSEMHIPQRVQERVQAIQDFD